MNESRSNSRKPSARGSRNTRPQSGNSTRRNDRRSSAKSTSNRSSLGQRRHDNDRRSQSRDERRSPQDRHRGERSARRDDTRTSRTTDGQRTSRPRRNGESRNDTQARPRRNGDNRTSSPRSASGRRTSRDNGRPQRSEESRGQRSSRPRPLGKPDVRGGRNENFDDPKFIAVDQNIDTKILPKQVLAELRNISPTAAEFVSKHLAAAMSALEDDDAARAYEHAVAARSRAARLGCVREMVGLSAYYSGKWSEALSEFRTFQRITGDPGFLPLMADCERGLGRPLRALQIARSPQVNSLDAATKIELRIVTSGARRDLGQFEAAVATLECPELHSKGHSEAVVRLKYAYADALLALGRKDAARDWFVKTALADVDDLTDAADRAVEISS